MTNDEFQKLRLRRQEKSDLVLNKKGSEYSDEDNRLHNFKQSAAILRCSVPEACLALMSKHLVSVNDVVLRNQQVTQDWIDEKIGDLHNYLELLEACIVENLLIKEK
jgi:hypothetical protein